MAHLVLDKDGLKVLNQNIAALRAGEDLKGTILLSFPGDKAKIGGCLATGRVFFPTIKAAAHCLRTKGKSPPRLTK